jgi:alkanesulfonate monooxygenase SsuD/methylene tetrahydromethanopterin reductase-like flavin-dependent oxidoreductase (luciferase family)
MVDRMALGVIPGVGWRASEIRSVAQEAEAAGFEAIFSAEVNNDVLATAQLMGEATKTIKVGTWIANIYLRHPYLCAKGAALIADATGGRMILGLGVSHQPVNRALNIDMPAPIKSLRQYTIGVTSWLRGEGPATHLPQQPAVHNVPVYLGALTSATVELAGELADGAMPFLWSAERIARSKTWGTRGRAKAPERKKLEMTLGLPTFVGDDMAALMATARANLGLYTALPFFQHLLHVSGFTAEAEKAKQGAGGDALSDDFLDAVCLIGPASRCRERLARFTAAGLDLPILVPPVGVDGARAVMSSFKL